MVNKIILYFLLLFSIGLISAIPVCSDINQQDISKMPCVGFTIPINCSGNVSVYNTTNPEINFTYETFKWVGDVYNFTLNLSNGGYELIDCENNTATFEVKLLEQGYGITMFIIILPGFFLTLICLFVSGRMFSRYREEDDENYEYASESNDMESFVPRNRLLPIVFMLFAFVPMVFITGFVNSHLEEYLPTANATVFYGSFYILFSIIFYFTALISFVVWLSSFIKLRRVMRGLDDIE